MALPSDSLPMFTIAIEHGPFIVDLPMTVAFFHSFLYVCQRVNHHAPMVFPWFSIKSPFKSHENKPFTHHLAIEAAPESKVPTTSCAGRCNSWQAVSSRWKRRVTGPGSGEKAWPPGSI